MIKLKKLPIIFFSIIFVYACNNSERIEQFAKIDSLPAITPDYTNLVIPYNIAPLNFNIDVKAEQYQVEITPKSGKSIIIYQDKPAIEIPLKDWHTMLNANKGEKITIDVFVKNGSWKKYKTFTDSIASDNIDKYLTYRLINGAYILWHKMGIYQRNLETFEQTPIFENKSADDACVNCHMFSKHNPKYMQLHLRASHGGTIIISDTLVRKIDTKLRQTVGACAYPSWHPNGKLIAYSVNVIRQNLTSDHSKTQDVFDKASDIVIYNIKTNTVISIPQLTSKNLENLPSWSADGKTMYYISAPAYTVEAEKRKLVKYDLVSIPFDETKMEFGIPDTILKSAETGFSMTFPVASPEGNYLLFGTTDYGYFPVYHNVSDIYIFDIKNKTYHRADFSSESTDSYHSWSSTGRWIVFSSKRLDDTYSRTFITYVDKLGKTSKPFVLPQKDPLFYSSFMQNFNRPELITDKVEMNSLDFRDITLGEPIKANFK